MLTASDIKFYKSEVVTDSASNGGRKSRSEVISGARHSLFPRVSKAQRIAGLDRYRKEFMTNENADDDPAYDPLYFQEMKSNGGDSFLQARGTHTDTQADLATGNYTWVGTGILKVALEGGESSLSLTMENNDAEFTNGGIVHLSNKFLTGQTIDSGVRAGDSVQYTVDTWLKIAQTDDITYPNGIYIGNDMVMTFHASADEEWIQLAEKETVGEVIATGNGATTNLPLTTLANVTNGVCTQEGSLPVVTATIGAVEKTVNVDHNGLCSGYCDAGQLNMATGVWTVDINWLAAPDSASDVVVTYRENCFLYTPATNDVIVELAAQVAGSYDIADTFVAGCVSQAELSPEVTSGVVTSASGTFDDTTNPLTLSNKGTEQDDFTLTFLTGSTFSCAGIKSGSVGSGSTGSNFAPNNPESGTPYFTVLSAVWGGTWLEGDTVTFTTSPAALPIWWKEDVPAGTGAEPDNLTVAGWYAE
jgi:hypothetical protein